LVYPLIGILLTVLFVKFVIKEDIGHGVSKILYAISRQSSRIKNHNTWSSMVASSLTIGFGGSVGAEAPIVYTGASIGSNLARFFRLKYKYVTLMIGVGQLVPLQGFSTPQLQALFLRWRY
jgi:chloride channel protein, CIC family